jgi:hypothetical protein
MYRLRARHSYGWAAWSASAKWLGSESERAKVEQRAKKDPISGECSIYWTDAVSGNFGEIPASLEECEYLEVAAVWDARLWSLGGVTEIDEDGIGRDHHAGLPWLAQPDGGREVWVVLADDPQGGIVDGLIRAGDLRFPAEAIHRQLLQRRSHDRRTHQDPAPPDRCQLAQRPGRQREPD